MSTATIPVTPLRAVKFSPAQLIKADALVREGRLHEDGPDFLTKSSDGLRAYLINPRQRTCTCRAGRYGRPCAHLAAALAITEGITR